MLDYWRGGHEDTPEYGCGVGAMTQAQLKQIKFSESGSACKPPPRLHSALPPQAWADNHGLS